MYNGQQPIFILKEGTTRTSGKGAQSNNIAAAKAVADAVRSTLGPKGMDKILQSTSRGGHVSVTNDGATILKSGLIDNPAAKVLIDISKVQDDEVGDGTTSVCVLAGEFLRQAAERIEKKMHPQTVVDGFRLARKAALDALDASYKLALLYSGRLLVSYMPLAHAARDSLVWTHSVDCGNRERPQRHLTGDRSQRDQFSSSVATRSHPTNQDSL